MAIDDLATMPFPLSKASEQIDLKSIQHAQEIVAERKRNIALCSGNYLTADFSIYLLEEKDVTIRIGNGGICSMFNGDSEKAVSQFQKGKNCIAAKQKIQDVLLFENTTSIRLSELELKDTEDERSCFDIIPSNCYDLNRSQRKLAEIIYGSGDNFKKSMESLDESGVNRTSIYVLNPNYARNNLDDQSGILRLCVLYGYGTGSSFDAAKGDIKDERILLRGRRFVGEKDRQKISDFYKLLKSNPRATKVAADCLYDDIAPQMGLINALYLSSKHKDILL
ncbi:hypothetical protein KAR91_56445 [Candidatus Pacearchaeota archaeon]|nr:hypothetical protein [Candidatus Pacearchaeota archaeon]